MLFGFDLLYLEEEKEKKMKKLKFIGISMLASVALIGCKGDEKKDPVSMAQEVVNVSKNETNEYYRAERPAEDLSTPVFTPGEDDYETDTRWMDNLPDVPVGEVYVDEGGLPDSSWNVRVLEDMIDGNKMLYTNVSKNMHDLNGNFTEMTMFVREKKGRSFDRVDYEIFFKVDSGKYFCLDTHCFVNTRIGDSVKNYSYTNSKSGNLDTIFITARGHFLQELVKSNELVVEANFFRDGNRQFIFDVSNFPGKIFLDPDKP